MAERGRSRRRGESSGVSFDVNTFLEKTLSNFSLNRIEEAAAAGSNANMTAGNGHPRPANEGRPRKQRQTQNRPHARVDSRQRAAVAQPLLVAPPSASMAVDSLPLPMVKQPRSVRLSPSPSKTSLASAASSLRLCRICHLINDNYADPLITPCRCAGTMQFVHLACLVHWLEISTKKMCPSPQCELCGYYYKTSKCVSLRRLHFARCTHRDKILHLVFLLVLTVMIGCGALSIIYLKQDPTGRARTSLNTDDIIVIVCSVLFFCAFFVAVFTQYRAEASLCRVIFQCWLTNRNWRIRNYDRRDDVDLRLPRV